MNDPTFTVRAVEELRRQAAAIATQTPKRVLLVEDSDDDAELMLNRLRSEALGFDVERVSTGEEALQALESKPFELAIIDLMLPQMKGDVLLHRIRERWPHIHAIVVSGYLDQFSNLYEPGVHVTLIPKVVAQSVNRGIARAIGLK